MLVNISDNVKMDMSVQVDLLKLQLELEDKDDNVAMVVALRIIE